MPWGIVQLNRQLFAVPAVSLREIVPIPDVAAVPESPAHVRGSINLRGRVLTLVDTRRRLGFPSAHAETESFCAMLAQREQDHRNWLAELEASVNENRDFKLATNPHACAFGKWYDSYRAEDPWIASLLKKFDQPHQAIHGSAIEIRELVNRGQVRQAKDLLRERRAHVFASMMKLFAELQALVRNSRELALVLQGAHGSLAATVDAAVAVERLTAVENLPPGTQFPVGSPVTSLGRIAGKQELVLILDVDRLL